MWKVLQVLLIAVFVNCSYYSFSFAAFPNAPNTKMLLAMLGLLWFLFDSWRRGKGVPFSPTMLTGAIFAGLYSLVNLIAIEINDTNDYSYANYLTTFFVWVFSVYPALSLMRIVHGSITIPRITYYLTAVTVFQCVTALLIDNYPAFDDFCSSIVFWSLEFFASIDRLRCFSTALDPAGVRFALVLILIAVTICVDEQVQQSSLRLYLLFIAYLLISGIGNMVARTTSSGMGLGLLMLLIHSNAVGLKVRSSMVRTMSIFGGLLLIAFGIGIYLYNTSDYYRGMLEFAFEGFFSLFNKGEFQTSSTDVLATMWIWPTDMQTWIIGSGIYGSFAFGSDIGYCRLILYSGLVGFGLFALSFIYYAFHFANKFRPYRWLFLAFLAMTFIIWAKVSTDIMMIYAFFFWFTKQEEDAINGLIPLAQDTDV